MTTPYELTIAALHTAVAAHTAAGLTWTAADQAPWTARLAALTREWNRRYLERVAAEDAAELARQRAVYGQECVTVYGGRVDRSGLGS